MSFDSVDMNLPLPLKRNVRTAVPAPASLWEGISENTKEHARFLVKTNWQFLLTKQKRGWCSASMRIITLPEWAVFGINDRTRSEGYKEWYLSHEIAHGMDMCKHDHGPEFMNWLIRICPEKYLHFELGYKPRNATAAGITLHGLKRPVGDIGGLGF